MHKQTLMCLIASATFVLLSSGCVSGNPRHQNVQRILNAHEKGFEDAVLASPESEAFVQDALETIANLEGELIRRE